MMAGVSEQESAVHEAADGTGDPATGTGDPAGGTGQAAAGTVAYPQPQSWPTGRLLSAVARRVERRWDEYLAQWQLTHASVPVLVVLTQGPLSQREIAAQMHVTEQSLGRVLRGLQEQGHITREHHPADRRRRRVTLTASGRQALQALDQAQAVESLVGDSLTDEEITQLRGLLMKMVVDLPLPERRDKV